MNKITAIDPEARSTDLIAENIEHLKTLFPEALVDGRIDFAVLRQLLGDELEEVDEKYGLSWHGKRLARQMGLTFSNGTLRPCPKESVDWDSSQNLLIEGDNLEVLKLLQKSYARRVKLIYIDPPYNTGNDLIYPNDYTDPIAQYLAVTAQSDWGNLLSTNAETSGRFHTNWLNMMYPRLKVAKTLLRRDGVLICTIDENEHANLGVMLKDIFDEGTYEHTCVTIVHNPRGIQGTNFSYTHEYAYFVVPRGAKEVADRQLSDEEIRWSHLRNWGTESHRTDARNCFYPILVKAGNIIGFGDVWPDYQHPEQTEYVGEVAYVYPIDKSGVERKWRYARQSVESIAHLLRSRKTDNGYEIEIGKNFGSRRTVWVDKRYDANEYGTKIVNALVPDSPFQFPKSLWNVYDCIQSVTSEEKECIVLDFFAGSGTTGHAVLQLNKHDGGFRRYILVQLPEPIKDNSLYPTIAEVTKTRMRAADDEIRQKDSESSATLGFKVFKLDSTNIRAWDPDVNDLEGSLLDSVDHIKADRSEQDVLYELLIKLGIDLCDPIEARTIADKTVHCIGSAVLIACLNDTIAREDIEPLATGIADWYDEMASGGPSSVVFRDNAFEDDVAKTNLVAILEQRGLGNVRSL